MLDWKRYITTLRQTPRQLRTRLRTWHEALFPRFIPVPIVEGRLHRVVAAQPTYYFVVICPHCGGQHYHRAGRDARTLNYYDDQTYLASCDIEKRYRVHLAHVASTHEEEHSA